jgi:hypothetical protein
MMSRNRSSLHGPEIWLQQHTRTVAGAVLAFGFLARLWAATGTFLNADEAQHFLVANRPSLAMAYKSSLTLAHPPLLIFVLYFWRNFGTSEFALRMSSVLAGILFCWVLFKWVSTILGDQVALLSLILVSLLPPLVSLTTQVRQYSLLLLFAALTGYLFEKALAENSARLMLLFSLSLYLSILSHYSSLFFAASIAAYAVLRFIRQRPPLPVFATWAMGQLGALALFIFLYRTHISTLKSRPMIKDATERWLHRSYFRPGQDHILLFIVGRTFGFFQFIFGHLVIGDVMALCFIAGVVLLFRWKAHDSESLPHETPHRQLAMFFVLPFALNCLAALLGAYPYGGSRHSVFLVMFSVAGLSFFLVMALKQRTARGLAISLIIVSACATFGKPQEPTMPRADQQRVDMNRSLEFLRQQIPHSTSLFVDIQTRLLLNYYLCREQQDLAEPPRQDFDVRECGGYRLITANIWVFTPDTFQSLWNQMVQTYGLRPGDPVWVIQEGWDVGIGPKLNATTPEFKDLKIESFGRSIQMFKLTVGQTQAFSAPMHAP